MKSPPQTECLQSGYAPTCLEKTERWLMLSTEMHFCWQG